MPGSEVTVLSYLAMTRYVLDAVAAVGNVDAEVIDLRWLDRASIDWDTIGESIRKTNRVLIAEQGALGTSYGGWLADEIQRRFFDWLDHPVQRVTGGEASPTISKVLERAAIARTDEVAGPGRNRESLTMAHLLRVPEVAAGTTEAVLAAWPVAENSPYSAADVIATVETDKAVIDIEAEENGVILRRLVAEGADVTVGQPIALIGTPGEPAGDFDDELRAQGISRQPPPVTSAVQAARPAPAAAGRPAGAASPASRSGAHLRQPARAAPG